MKDYLIFDLESDGLLPEATKLYCMGGIAIDHAELMDIEDISNLRPYSFIIPYSEDIDMMKESISEKAKCVNIIVGHNIIEYDIPLLLKLYPDDVGRVYENKRKIDTLVWSRILDMDAYPPKGMRGIHSVEAWGARFGLKKYAIEDFTQLSPEEAEKRVMSDIAIQAMIFKSQVQRHLKYTGEIDDLSNIYEEGV